VRCLRALLRQKLVHHDSTKYDGYRLTPLGYDFLALKVLVNRGAVAAVGRQIGVGKESDVYEVRAAAAPPVSSPHACATQITLAGVSGVPHEAAVKTVLRWAVCRSWGKGACLGAAGVENAEALLQRPARRCRADARGARPTGAEPAGRGARAEAAPPGAHLVPRGQDQARLPAPPQLLQARPRLPELHAAGKGVVPRVPRRLDARCC